MREIRVLGPAEVLADGQRVPAGGPRQKAVLVVLALHAGHRCSAEQLIDGVWGERPPPSAVKTVRAYVSRLAAVLGDGTIVGDHGGYHLRAATIAVDALRFAELVQSARDALADDAPLLAERALSEALALWRGYRVGEGAQLEGLAAETRRLEELRLAAEQLRLDAWLALGRNAQAGEEAERLLAREPLREELWERLMLALYRGGRTADALAAYARVRRVLDGELGLEPGPALAGLQEHILRADLPVPAHEQLAGNLPAPVASFVGREAELAALAGLIASSRLVTLAGVGGAGKTRLAIEAASRWRDAHGAPAWFADLAPLRDAGLVPSAVMAATGAVGMPGADPLEVCARQLRTRRALLVLDNCEHVADACAQAAQALLESCPRLLVLATSRAPLALAGETVYTVPPLATPNEQVPRWRAELPAGYDAVRLFLERAGSAAGSGTAAQLDVSLVGELCRRLDGLPLAIEFAAARTRSMSLPEIAAGMSDRFALLAPARQVGPGRHRTLRAAIDWSHDLLSGDEQALLRRLSVFEGGFTADAAAAACSAHLTAPVPDLLQRLVNASLIVAVPAGAHTRFRLYETVREYAAGRLTDPAERAHTSGQHALYYCALAERAAAELTGPQEQGWLQRLGTEYGNLRAALRWARSQPTGHAPLARIAIALAPFWRLRGMLDEGAGWLETALAAAAGEPAQQAALRIWLGTIRYRRSELDDAALLLAAGVRAARAAAAPALAATGLHWLAAVSIRRARFGDAVPLAEEAVAVWEQLGNPVAAAWDRGMLADLAVWQGRYADAEALYQKGLAVIRQHGPPSMLVAYLHSLAELAYATGELDRAEALCRETLPVAEQIGDVWHVGNLHDVLARLSRRRGRPSLASKHGLRALAAFDGLRCVNEIAEAIEVLGGSCLDLGDHPGGALLLAGARQLRQTSGIPLVEIALRTTTEDDWATATKLCGDGIAAIEQRAAALTLDQLVSAANRAGAGQ